MAIPDKTAVNRATTNAATIPDFPKLPSSALDLPGMQEFQVLQQNWWDVVRRQITASDQATSQYAKKLASANGASVTEVASAVATIDGYLEAFWSLTVNANNALTGIQLFASDQADGEGTAVSEIILLADSTKIYTSSGGNKQLFSATASAVKLGDVLTVDLANQALYIGAGNFGNSDTAFYVDDAGQLSLKDKFTWDGSDLDIDANTLTLGSGNTELYADGTDLTIGNTSGYHMLYSFIADESYAASISLKLDTTPLAVLRTISTDIIPTYQAGLLQISRMESSSIVSRTSVYAGYIYFDDGSGLDTNLYRDAANTLKTDDKFIADTGLGVGNAASATSMGSITDAIEVFDGDGNSLGYVPVYDSFS